MRLKKTISMEVSVDTETGKFTFHPAHEGDWLRIDGIIDENGPALPQALVLCPGDSDTVQDLGELFMAKGRKHKITENNNGTCDVFCPHSRHKYRHTIKVPNKNELVCRGCGRTI